MTDTPKQRRTAASIVEGIRAQFVAEQHLLTQAQAQVALHTTRLAMIDAILDESEKSGESE